MPEPRLADCPDDGRVELFRNACPFCGGPCVPTGGIPSRVARKFPWLRRLKVVKPAVEIQRYLTGFRAFRKGR